MRSAAFWALPALALTAFTLIWFYRASTYRIFDDPLISTIRALIAHVESAPDSPGTLVLTNEPIDPRYQLALSGRYWLIGELDDGGYLRTILGSPSLYGASLALSAGDTEFLRYKPGATLLTRSLGPDQESLRLVAQAVSFPGQHDRPVIIIAAADRGPAVQAVRQFSLIALALTSVLAIALAGGILWQVRLGLQPLFDLRRRVEDVREGRSGSVIGNYSREINPLAEELNSLMVHNRDIVEQAKTHVGNLAHALKTPLTVLRNEAGSETSGLAVIVDRQTAIMSQQVEHHLGRARAAARGQGIGVHTPVLQTMTGLVRTLERIYRDRDLEIQVRIDPDLMFRGERQDLEEMIGNLLDNACKWAQRTIRVRSGIDPVRNRFAMIEVHDDGAGLSHEEYDLVLERGTRLDQATPGTGFGLSIVNDLARAYKGSLTLGKSDLGGLKTELCIPVALRTS